MFVYLRVNIKTIIDKVSSGNNSSKPSYVIMFHN